MAKLREHRELGEAFLAAGQGLTRVSHRFALPARAVWASLLDPEAWTVWLPITEVVWTSPQPFDARTTRTVHVGKQVIEEQFFAWEEGRRMAFYFARSTLPVRGLVEDYRVSEEPGGCRLDWTVGVDAMFLLAPLIRAKLARDGKRGLPRLEAHIAAHPERYMA